jgi:predicted dehydrogenase
MTDLRRRDALQLLTAALLTAPAVADEPKKRRIKVGQIGVGHAHASKLSVYRQSDDYEVVGIVEPDEGLRKRAEGQAPYKDLPWMTQEQLLNQPGLEAVLIETQVRDLLNAAEAAVLAGKHIHLDKPAGADLEQFRRIVENARRQKLLIQMGYMYRYNPGITLLNEIRRQGWLGDVFEIHTVMSKVVGAGDRKELAEYSGGILFELGGHILDLVIGQLGKPEQVTGFRRHASPLDDGLMDNGLAVLTYPRAIASIKTSAQEVAGGDRRHFVICGTEATLQIQPLDAPSCRLAFSQPRGDYRAQTQEVKLPKFPRYVDDAADMAKILRGEKASDFSYDHDLTVQETLLQACGMGEKA